MSQVTPTRRHVLIAALAAAALSACGADKPAFTGIDITGADYATGFDLTDHLGQRRTLADFKGKAVVIFFGFTQCPDVCPTSLSEMAQAKQLLGPDGDRLQVLFVSVDPERDTPEVLEAYFATFGAGFVGLRGSAEETAAVAKHFKIYYNKVPGKTATSYTMDHTAGSYVFDAGGRVRLFTRHGTGAEALAHDLKLLLAERPAG